MIQRSDRVRTAGPLIGRFLLSGHCPLSLRPHARSLLTLVAAGLAHQTAGHDSLDWGRLDPDALAMLALEAGPDNVDFVCATLEVTAAFYGWLGDTDRLCPIKAIEIRHRLIILAIGLSG